MGLGTHCGFETLCAMPLMLAHAVCGFRGRFFKYIAATFSISFGPIRSNRIASAPGADSGGADAKSAGPDQHEACYWRLAQQGGVQFLDLGVVHVAPLCFPQARVRARKEKQTYQPGVEDSGVKITRAKKLVSGRERTPQQGGGPQSG